MPPDARVPEVDRGAVGQIQGSSLLLIDRLTSPWAVAGVHRAASRVAQATCPLILARSGPGPD